MKLADDGLLPPSTAVALLEGPAAKAPPAVASRLAEVAKLFGDDLATIERLVQATTREGMGPGTDAAAHLARAGGKRVRPLLVLLAHAVCSSDAGPVTDEARRAACELAAVSELIHLATLLHDDVLDDGEQRRGMPTARRIYGNAVSVLAGDLLLTHALERTHALAMTRPALHAVAADLYATLRRLVDGEIVQLRGRTVLDPNEDTYFLVVRNKTASLFGWAARAGARVAGADDDVVVKLGAFGEAMGTAFQLVDDALDYEGNDEKTKLADLREGKLTLPLLRTLVSRPELRRDIETVRGDDGPAAEAAALRIARAVRDGTACVETRRVAGDQTSLALAALTAVPASAARDLLAAVARELTGRPR